jgi:hypothetical protein
MNPAGNDSRSWHRTVVFYFCLSSNIDKNKKNTKTYKEIILKYDARYQLVRW